jgi:hypothetical protein
MSKRPKIRTRREKAAERSIQQERRARDRRMKAEGKKGSIRVEPPVELSFSRGPVEREVAPEVETWIAAEATQQEKNYRRIYREVARLEPQREIWVKEFFRRITGPRGFSVHAGTRRTLDRSELPRRPRRPWRVVW